MKQSNDEGYVIPWNATVKHTMKDGESVTAIISPDGQPVSWTKDKDSAKIAVPGNRQLPATSVYVVPSEAIVNRSSQRDIVVTDPTSWDLVISVKNDASLASSSLSSSSGVYYLNKGGVVTTTIGDNVFRTPSLNKTSSQTDSDSRSYDYLSNEFGNGQRMNILCDSQSAAPNCVGLVDTKSINNLESPQHLDFSIIPSSDSNKAPLDLSSEISAVKEGNLIRYTITSHSSQNIPIITISPSIFNRSVSGPNLLDKTPDYHCENTTTCSVSGTFSLNQTGAYFVHGYITFMVPDSYAGPDNPQNYYLMPDSQLIENPPARTGLQADNFIHQLDDKDIWLWGWGDSAVFPDIEHTSTVGPINFIVLNNDENTFKDHIDSKIPTNMPLYRWTSAAGLVENGKAGSSPIQTYLEVIIALVRSIGKRRVS